MSRQSPAFQFYPNDFLGSGKVGSMTADEVGIYVLLLCLEWNETGFAYDEEELSRWCRTPQQAFVAAWRRVSRCFVERDGKFYNPRLDAEREKQDAWREKSRAGGLKSAESRKGGSTVVPRVVQPPYQPKGNTQSSTPVTTRTTSTASAAGATGPEPRDVVPAWPARFAAIWGAQVGHVAPGRVGKTLKAAVDKHGSDPVEQALRGYIAVRKSDGKPCKLNWFADESEVWIERTASPLDVIDGEMSPTLELLTRPPMAKGAA